MYKRQITYRVSHKTGLIVDCALVSDELDVLLINDKGVIIRFSASDIPTLGRNTQGVTLMRSRDGVVVDMAIVEHEDEEAEVETEEEKEETIVSEGASGEVMPLLEATDEAKTTAEPEGEST